MGQNVNFSGHPHSDIRQSSGPCALSQIQVQKQQAHNCQEYYDRDANVDIHALPQSVVSCDTAFFSTRSPIPERRKF